MISYQVQLITYHLGLTSTAPLTQVKVASPLIGEGVGGEVADYKYSSKLDIWGRNRFSKFLQQFHQHTSCHVMCKY